MKTLNIYFFLGGVTEFKKTMSEDKLADQKLADHYYFELKGMLSINEQSSV